jgi:dihydroorotase-like cyclic amidohydrolase
MNTLTIHNVRPLGGETTSVTIRNGRIAAFGEDGREGETILDGAEAILIPRPIRIWTRPFSAWAGTAMRWGRA